MDKDYQAVLLEQIRDQNKAILEGQKDQASRADIRRLEQDIGELKDDMKVVKAAVKATSRDVVTLDRRVTRLEAA